MCGGGSKLMVTGGVVVVGSCGAGGGGGPGGRPDSVSGGGAGEYVGLGGCSGTKAGVGNGSMVLASSCAGLGRTTLTLPSKLIRGDFGGGGVFPYVCSLMTVYSFQHINCKHSCMTWTAAINLACLLVPTYKLQALKHNMDHRISQILNHVMPIRSNISTTIAQARHELQALKIMICLLVPTYELQTLRDF